MTLKELISKKNISIESKPGASLIPQLQDKWQKICRG